MKVNLHTHTARCNHASGTDREYVLAAIEDGVDVLGFADHTPYTFDDGFNTWYRMPLEETRSYFDSILALKKEFADKIDIKIGFETEYYEKYFERLIDFYQDFPIDFIIMGQHETKDAVVGTNVFAPIEDPELLKEYVSTVISGINTGYYTYIAHPDAIKFTGDIDIYKTEMRKICEAAKKADIPLELNLQGLAMNRHYPRFDFWQIASDVGNTVVIGSDAHQTTRVFKQEEIDDMYKKFIIPLNLNIIEYPTLVSVKKK